MIPESVQQMPLNPSRRVGYIMGRGLVTALVLLFCWPSCSPKEKRSGKEPEGFSVACGMADEAVCSVLYGLDTPPGLPAKNPVLRASLAFCREGAAGQFESPIVLSDEKALAELLDGLREARTQAFPCPGSGLTGAFGRADVDLRGGHGLTFWLTPAGFCASEYDVGDRTLFYSLRLAQAIRQAVRNATAPDANVMASLDALVRMSKKRASYNGNPTGAERRKGPTHGN